MVSAIRLEPADLLAIEPQASQSFTLGIDTRNCPPDKAEELCAQDESWAIRADGRLIAAFGIYESFPGAVGICWAILCHGIGSAHLAMTRFAASRIRASHLPRLEGFARCADAEAILDQYPGLDSGQMVEAVLALPTPECIWARLVGLKPAHVLRKFGASGESVMLFERIS